MLTISQVNALANKQFCHRRLLGIVSNDAYNAQKGVKRLEDFLVNVSFLRDPMNPGKALRCEITAELYSVNGTVIMREEDLPGGLITSQVTSFALTNESMSVHTASGSTYTFSPRGINVFNKDHPMS